MLKRKSWTLALCFWMLFFLCGCGATTAARFYKLSPVGGVEMDACEDGISLGVGPVTFPRYLDRPQIVTGMGSEIRMLEFDQWAGSLQDDFTHVLSENLGALLKTSRISLYPVKRAVPADFRVSVEVLRFDGVPGKVARLSARWVLFTGGGRKMLHMGRTHVEEVPEGPRIADFVSAQSRAVERLAADIAAKIREAGKTDF